MKKKKVCPRPPSLCMPMPSVSLPYTATNLSKSLLVPRKSDSVHMALTPPPRSRNDSTRTLETEQLLFLI